MPEIKHQFTGGKMNQDLDERLIPNGQYKEALNIQVSTSEDSDVGTVQNILGNSLIPGQDFIGANVVCVGSIADEKNDKLYYFVTQNNLLSNGSFDNNGLGWNITGGNYTGLQWGFTNNQAVGTDGDDGTIWANAVGVVDGNRYTITYDIVVPKSSGGSLILANHTTDASTLNSTSGNNNVNLIGEDAIGTYTVEWEQGPAIARQNSVWLYNNNDYDGTIDNLSVFESSRARSLIVEYNSTTNTITPVFVDMSGDVLKFNKDNLITGINIIDDLLFWTDNENEPKKINIQRSIEGTDSSGIVHTKIINKRQDIDITNNIFAKEEDITVIKKGPRTPLGLNFTSPAERENKVYTGVIQTTDGTATSSFISNETQGNYPDNFSNILKNDVIRTEIPEDIDLNSGFVLDWKVGDVVVFKEFGDDGAPSVPLTLWTAEGVIEEWSDNTFQDTSTSLLSNGSFDINMNSWGKTADVVANPFGGGSTGLQPYGWTWRGSIQSMIFRTGPWGEAPPLNPYAKLWQSPANHNFKAGDSYTLQYDLGDIPGAYGNPDISLVGGVTAGIALNGEIYFFSFQNTVDTHVETLVLSPANKATQTTNLQNHIFFQTNNQQCRGIIDNVILDHDNAPNAQVQIRITNIDASPPTPTSVNSSTGILKYAVDKFDQRAHLFKDKLVRFSYRYKYQDGEYSVFAPFSNVAFLPGNFDYHNKKGFNLGMDNQLIELELLGFVASDLPKEVVEINILAKVENSTNVYIVDTIRPDDETLLEQPNNAWDLNKYTITSDTIKGIVPSNQLLRPWDNVPKRALSQEISGNRLIYGNYTQGYNLLTESGDNYKPQFNVDVDDIDSDEYNKKSIKSLRDYQVGVVFSDEHGRETPVLSNQSASFHLGKDRAEKNNVLSVSFLENEYPVDMKYFKFFIKETSSEYYNMAMDRYYVDDNSNVWLSFTSADRNKIDLDSVLILKKGIESNESVGEEAVYKVLAIQGEAPDFVITSKLKIEEQSHVFATKNIFGDTLVDAPLQGRDNFKMNHSPFASSSGDSLHKIDDGELYVEFGLLGTSRKSEKYKINQISCDVDTDGVAPIDANYSIKLDVVLGDDVNFITNDPEFGLNPTKIVDYTSVTIYKYVIDKKARFEGRFFVKIFGDEVFKQEIETRQPPPFASYRVVGSQKLYFMNANHVATHGSSVTGHSGTGSGAYDSDRSTGSYTLDPNIDYPSTGGIPDGEVSNPYPHNWNKFSCFAVFFRNYKYENSTETLLLADGTNTQDVGKYKFGDANDDDWKDEFKNYTSGGSSFWDGGWDTVETAIDPQTGEGNPYPTPIPTKVADERKKEDEVWFIDNGPVVSYRGFNNYLHWQWCHPSSNKQRPGIYQYADNWTMDIALGGISGSTGLPSNPNFFGIPANTNYNDNDTVSFVEKLSPSVQFRFKEDPSETVYSFAPATSNLRLLRYASNHRSGYDSTHYGLGNPPNTAGGFALQEHEIPQLSPNFTNNWRLKVDGQIGWNPASGQLGPIDNGLELTATLVSSALPATSSGNQDTIEIVSNIVEDPVYGSRVITPGLIMTEYNDGTAMPDQNLLIDTIEITPAGTWLVRLCGYEQLAVANDYPGGTSTAFAVGSTVKFQQPRMNGYSTNSANRINVNSLDNGGDFSIESPGLKAVGYTIEFVEEIIEERDLPDNPAVFETEPKEQTSLDVYHEATGLLNTVLDETTIASVLPIGSKITSNLNPGSAFTPTGLNSYIPDNTYIDEHVDGNTIKVSNLIPVAQLMSLPEAHPQVWSPGIDINKPLAIMKPNGFIIYVSVQSVVEDANFLTNEISINPDLWKEKIFLDYHNCYSFGNGVESNRIRDVFNQQYISNGVRVSTTLDTEYQEENRKSGLIYSGIYNSNGNTNNLNQFIASEKITKDLNPIYGSIQKLHSRDSDLVTLCEDKCLRILIKKDALFNADGNAQLLATEGVLGQTVPFSGEYGISKNPESFASESYRVYFTDKIRGTVLRLSKDGLTPISMHGMNDWFKDNLQLSAKIIGSYDDKKEEYNVTLEIPPGYIDTNPSTTVSFKEDVKGWVSFKSFVPEQAISMAANYYTILDGKLYKHHDKNQPRNNFYNNQFNSSINVVLNDGPGSVKHFHTLCYEGSQSNVTQSFQNDGKYYNLTGKSGWFVSNIETDKQVGSLNEFIEKEGKWFNYIKGIDSDISELDANGINQTDFGAFNIQGIGILSGINPSTSFIGATLIFDNNINTSLQVGDIIYSEKQPSSIAEFNTIDSSSITKYGRVIALTKTTITVDNNAPVNQPLGVVPEVDDYIMFAKNNVVNVSSLLGYYADVKLENNSIEKAKLFALSSEITESSK